MNIILIKGYFNNDCLNLYKLDSIFKNKNTKIKEIINNYNISKQFKNAYINQLSIRDYIINDEELILEKCEKSYNLLKN